MSLSKTKPVFSISSARVKCLDFHQTQPLLLAALYSGEGYIIDCANGMIIKSLQVHPGVPLRTCRWVPQSGLVVFGGDKCTILFFSPTKGKLVKEVMNAHERYVRSIAIHPTEPKMLSCSDDLTIKLWDISGLSDNNATCQLLRVFDMHTGLVMDVKWNPKDTSTFASCSLDGTSIFWDVNNAQPRFTQKISSKPVNCISFAASGERPLMATASDDNTVQVWDLQTRSLLITLEGHENNVSRVEFHPTRPIIITTSEDSTTFIWSLQTFTKENTILSGMERGWAIAISNISPLIAIGYDRGLSVVKFVNNAVPMSFDNSGKLIEARGSDLSTSTIKNVLKTDEIVDGAEIPLNWKEALTMEFPIIDLIHSPNGRFVAVLGDDKYSILTTLGFRTKAFGKGFKFAWAQNSTNYAVLDVVGSVQLYQNFELDKTIDRFCKKIWGGTLLSVLADNGVEFYDWDSGLLIRRIEEKVSEVKWSGDIVAMRTKDTIFILQYFPPNPDDAENQYDESSGYENSFTLLHQIDAKSSSICWSSGILFFTENLKVNRFVSGIVQSTATLKTPVDLLGYLPRENLLVLVDYQRKIIGFNLPYALLDFEVSIADGEEPDPESVPEEYRASCAKFLKQIGQKELALEVATDPVMKFDLALELERLDVAQKLALELEDKALWKRLARAALNTGDFDMAKISITKCGDYSTLLILYKVKNLKSEMEELVELAEKAGQFNVAFTAAMLTDNKVKACQLLLKSGKYAEAALFARSRIPSMISECVKLWRENAPNPKIAEAIADPAEYPNLFDEMLEQQK